MNQKETIKLIIMPRSLLKEICLVAGLAVFTLALVPQAQTTPTPLCVNVSSGFSVVAASKSEPGGCSDGTVINCFTSDLGCDNAIAGTCLAAPTGGLTSNCSFNNSATDCGAGNPAGGGLAYCSGYGGQSSGKNSSVPDAGETSLMLGAALSCVSLAVQRWKR